jgi:hypothetical protein
MLIPHNIILGKYYTGAQMKRQSSIKKESQLYTSKILKANALVNDTSIFLSAWDNEKTKEQNMQIIRQENILNKKSRSRSNDILNIFQQRFLFNDDVIRSLSYLQKKGTSKELMLPLLYYFTAKNDLLLHDFVVKFLQPLYENGQREIPISLAETTLRKWDEEGKTAGKWSDETIIHVAQHALATLRDYHLLEGVVNKRICPLFVPDQAFAYLAMFMSLSGMNGERLVKNPEWQLFFLTPQLVERFFMSCHQEGYLTYHAAGSIYRIDFPYKSLEELCHEFT